ELAAALLHRYRRALLESEFASDLEQVPFALALGRTLDLEHVTLPDHTAIRQHVTVFGVEVIDRRRTHLRHYRVPIRSASRLQSVQIVHYGSVHADLLRGRRPLHLPCKAL